MGSEGGAACDRVPPRTDVLSSPYIKRRFQQGAVDEVSFAGPDLGALTAIVVGPESGSWQMEEITVSNSREALTQRFICREDVGTEGTSAAFLTPLPPNAVVYGSGEQAVLMTPVRALLKAAAAAAGLHCRTRTRSPSMVADDSAAHGRARTAGRDGRWCDVQTQASAVRRMGVRDYLDLKDRIFKTTVVLVFTGMAVSGAVGGADAAEAFTVGGAIAFFYQLALTNTIDSMPLEQKAGASAAADAPAADVLSGWTPSAHAAPRLVLTGILMLAAICATQMWDSALSPSRRPVLWWVW